MWKKCDTALIFSFISYTLRWNRCSLWGRNVFLYWLLYTVPMPWREIPPQTHRASGCTGLMLPCPLSLFLTLVTLVLCRKECSCLMPVAVVLYVSLMGVLQRRKQKAAKSKVLDQIKSSNFNGNFAPLSTFVVFVSPWAILLISKFGW